MPSQRIVITGAGGQVGRFLAAEAAEQGVSTDDRPRPAPRPPYSALSAHRSARAGLTPLRPWRRDERLREEQTADALAAALR